MSIENEIKGAGRRLANSINFKILTIGFLIIVLLIPVSLVTSLIHEREQRRDDVVREISDKWGDSQTIAGPVLTIPYKNWYRNSEGQMRYNIHYAHFLPETLEVSGTLLPEIRYRGIYEAVLYRSDLALKGSFAYPDFASLNISEKDALWERAYISLGITDMKGIRDTIKANFSGSSLSTNPGIDSDDVLKSGISARIHPPGKEQPISFDFALALNGSQIISFIPVGRHTMVHMSSEWPSPSFTGSFLPVERHVSAKGFEAKWKVLHLNRNYPQAWLGNKYNIRESAFGVRLFVAADIYQQTERTAKYAVLFILFMFAAFFFSEIMTGRRIHTIQYLFIGFAISLFYVLLISISEHSSFDVAYLISCIATIGLISGYTWGFLRSKRMATIVLSLLVLLYTFLYIVLQLEDYALLMGSVGMFAVLATAMYLTRNIDWYATSMGGENRPRSVPLSKE